MELAKVFKCTCQHKTQDELHGLGRRCHNAMAINSKNSVQKYRCTVCGAVRER